MEREMADPIRVAVIDDHPLFRQGAIQALTKTDGIEVVGEGATATDALRVAQDFGPDVILIDVAIPGGGIEAVASIARHCQNVRAIMLTASDNEQDVASALQAGARGYILKGSSGSEMVETVCAIFRGESYVAPSLGARLLMRFGKRIQTIDRDDTHNLTSREEEILQLVSQGKTNKEIANGLNCTERTVKHHMTNIMRKSNARNRVEAALKFCRHAN
jgi:DNA-binding NarL/FixJ family response regulator